MKTLILLSAIPGSGKSTWAKEYVKNHSNCYIVSSDDTRERVAGKVNCFTKEELVWKTFLDDINNYALSKEDVTVIADATNIKNEFREYYYKSTPGFDRHILVTFDIPYNVCLLQNKMRKAERVVPDYAMKRLSGQWEPVSDQVLSLYDEHIVVGTEFSPVLMGKKI